MMNKYFLALNMLLLLTQSSCINRTEKVHFNGSNKIKEIREYVKYSDSLNYQLTSFYFNGKLEASGEIKNGQRKGFWQEWSENGELIWEGEYIQGSRQYLDFPKKYSLFFQDSVLKVNKLNYVKIVIDSIHPMDIAIGVSNGIIKPIYSKRNFEYYVIPNKIEQCKFKVWIKTIPSMTELKPNTIIRVSD